MSQFFLALILLLLLLPQKAAVNATGTIGADDQNKRIRLFLAHYMEDNEAKEALERAEPSEELAFRMPIVKELLNAIANEVFIEMTKNLQNSGTISQNLANFRQNYYKLTDKMMGDSVSRAEDKQMNPKDDVRLLNLLLSFVLQMGYTVGSKAMGLENDGQKLKLLRKLYSYLERYQNQPNIYLGALFVYAEREQILRIKFFPAESDHMGRQKHHFQLLKSVFEERERTVFDIIVLLEHLLNKKMMPNEQSLSSHQIEEKNETKSIADQKPNTLVPYDKDSVWIGQDMKKLMEAWSNGSNEFKSNIALYQLKCFGRDLGQRLLDAEQLQRGLFQLFPTIKDRIQLLVSELKEEAHKFDQKLNDEDRKHLQNKPNMHYEEVLLVDFGMERVLEKLDLANKLVVKWPIALEGMTGDNCAPIISDILTDKKFFDCFYMYKFCRFDHDVRTAMDSFSIAGDFAKEILVMEQNYFDLNAKIRNKGVLMSHKRKYFDMESNRSDWPKGVMLSDKELKIVEKEKDELEKNLKHLRLKCLADKAQLREEVQLVVNALVNLKAKANKIVGDQHSAAKGGDIAGTSGTVMDQ